MSFPIVDHQLIAPGFHQFRLEAPRIARKHKAGQFVILMIDSKGERLPFTIADKDPEAGTIDLIVQEVGKSTMQMGLLNAGDSLAELVGPLGLPTHIEKLGTVVCIGGGAGIAPLLPITRSFREAGNHIVSILGGRTGDFVILDKQMEETSDEFIVSTDDGSRGLHGRVTDALQQWLDDGNKADLVIAIGPAVMMKAVAEMTRPLAIHTMASLNSIMVDGTGMCGACRLTVDGETKFVCVDGPEFDAHKVDFDQLIQRLRMYRNQEQQAVAAYRKEHTCQSQKVAS